MKLIKSNFKMVGQTQLVLEKILTDKQIYHILEQSLGNDAQWNLKKSEVRPAVEGMAGFLGDHLKAVLHVEVQGEEKKVHLFLKRIPVVNEIKAAIITESNFYKREEFMYKLLEKICDNGPNPWGVRAYIYTDSIVVMPDLSLEGYSMSYYLKPLDLEHVLLTTSALARFHAAFVNYETKKSIERGAPYNTYQEVGHILEEAQFRDTPWLRAGSKATAKLLENYSTKSYHHQIPDLESKLLDLYFEACDSLKEYEDTVNVIIHRDLWANNIMFKYENNVPINAVLVDFQCVRYAPPAFDLLGFLYLNTDRTFRQEREKDIFDYYYSTFVKNLDEDSKKRLSGLGYDKEDFLKWCEKVRMFGMLAAVALHPLVLMDPKSAQETFDDPKVCEKHFLQDRSEPVVAYAAKCEMYKQRNIAIAEEFVESYALKRE